MVTWHFADLAFLLLIVAYIHLMRTGANGVNMGSSPMHAPKISVENSTAALASEPKPKIESRHPAAARRPFGKCIAKKYSRQFCIGDECEAREIGSDMLFCLKRDILGFIRLTSTHRQIYAVLRLSLKISLWNVLGIRFIINVRLEGWCQFLSF